MTIKVSRLSLENIRIQDRVVVRDAKETNRRKGKENEAREETCVATSDAR